MYYLQTINVSITIRLSASTPWRKIKKNKNRAHLDRVLLSSFVVAQRIISGAWPIPRRSWTLFQTVDIIIQYVSLVRSLSLYTHILTLHLTFFIYYLRHFMAYHWVNRPPALLTIKLLSESRDTLWEAPSFRSPWVDVCVSML